VHASVRQDTSRASVTAHASVEGSVVAEGVDAAHTSVEEGSAQAKASDTEHARMDGRAQAEASGTARAGVKVGMSQAGVGDAA